MLLGLVTSALSFTLPATLGSARALHDRDRSAATHQAPQVPHPAPIEAEHRVGEHARDRTQQLAVVGDAGT